MSARARLPNFFIVGAQKAGTTSLYDALGQHPEIYTSPIKEPNFFGMDSLIPDKPQRWLRLVLLPNPGRCVKSDMSRAAGSAHIRDWDDYTLLFKNATNEKAIGENSNLYLLSKTAAREIRKAIPDARILIVLRDPVERMFSQHLDALMNGYTYRRFAEAVNEDRKKSGHLLGPKMFYCEFSMYHNQVERYLTVFPRERVRIYLSEDLWREPERCMREIFGFLRVDDSFGIELGWLNASTPPRFPRLNAALYHSGVKSLIADFVPGRVKGIMKQTEGKPRLSRAEREALVPLFIDDIKRLERLIDRDLSHWIH